MNTHIKPAQLTVQALHILQSRKWKWKLLSCVRLLVTPWTIQFMEFSRPEYLVGRLSLLQEFFPTQGSNSDLLHSRWILYQLSHKGSPRILDWVAYPFSIGSSQHRNETGVSCIAGRFFTNWAIREALTVQRGTSKVNAVGWWKTYIFLKNRIPSYFVWTIGENT